MTVSVAFTLESGNKLALMPPPPRQRTSPIFHASWPRARPAAPGHTMAPRAHAPEWTMEELREAAQRIADRIGELAGS